MDNVQAIAVIIGIVNGVTLAKDPDRWGFILFIIALGVGILLGALRLFGLSLETGIVAALASSGVYKVAQKVGGTN